jgi:homoserine kinase type II
LDHQSLRGEFPAVLEAWGLPPAARVEPVAGGTLNWNFRVDCGPQRLFLRCYRQNLETERILGEHALVQWNSARGVPAPVPLRTAAGDTLLEWQGNRWALFPWMPGAAVPRGNLSPRQAWSLGEMHGRIQAGLATHPASRDAALGMRWSKEQSLSLLTRLEAASRERREEPWLTAGIARQRELLTAAAVLPPEAFSSLPCQLLHGDFHDQQVLFEGDHVSAVVDWEIWHTDPRAWELARSLAFSGMLDSPLRAGYLAGYREHVRLGEDEAALALRLWFQSRLVGVWAWWAYLMEGNARVRDFFPTMIAELERVSDGRWTAFITAAFVREACGP